jgi:putative membrane protein
MKTVKLLIFSLTVAALAACNNDTKKNPAEAAQEVNEERTDTNKSEEDAETLVEAATSDMMEIQSSQKAATMATSAAVKEFAAMMIEEHTKMSNETKELAAKKGYVLPTSLSQDKMDKLADMDKWDKKDWDEKYMEMQIDMHETSLREIKNRHDRSNDADIKAWAVKAMSHVQMHLDRAKQLEDNVDDNPNNNTSATDKKKNM